MRTSGKGSDLTVLFVPLALLIVAGLLFSGDPNRLLPNLEKHLWTAVDSVGRWVSALLS